MDGRLHPHARIRMVERGATENEVRETIETGERFPAKFARTGFRKNFVFQAEWNEEYYSTKQIEAFAVEENGWTVITVIVKYF